MIRCAAVLTGLAVAAGAAADTLLVPSYFPTIQQAVDAASSGDVVALAPGFYEETVRVESKALTIRGFAGAAATVIDGMGKGSVIEFVDAPGMVTLEGLTIQNGVGDCRGGGVLVTGSSVAIYSCVIQDNLAYCTLPGDGKPWGGDGLGGGVYCDQNAVVMNSVVRGNHAKGHPYPPDCTGLNGADGAGGGIYVENGLWLTGCRIEENIAENVGCGGSGGAGIRAGALDAQDSEICHNVAIGGSCGGTSYSTGAGLSAGTAWLARCHIHHNDSAASNAFGGGLSAADAHLDRCTLHDNSVGGIIQGLGSEIWAWQGEVTNTLVVLGTNAEYPGIWMHEGSIANSTIVHPFSSFPSVCIRLAEIGGGSSTVVNSIFWSSCTGSQPLLVLEGLAQNCLVRGGFPGVDVIDADPKFVDPAAGDFRLAAGSPCIDAGIGFPLQQLLALDLDGNPRFLFGACLEEEATDHPPVDIGCFEHVHLSTPFADLNGDCHVGRLDLAALLTSWIAAEVAFADLNEDGVIDSEDLGLLLAYWTE